MEQEPAFVPFIELPGDWTRGLLLLCDHARCTLPHDYGDLGLTPDALQRHIAYDIGAEAVTRKLSTRLGVPAIMAGFSRLLIDPNRSEDDPTLIRQLYDGTVIPANYPMGEEERARRLDGFYRPYHKVVAQAVDRMEKESGCAPFILSMHSFTPRLGNRPRPWHVGILWDTDHRAAWPLIEMLAADPALVVGDNEPYDGALRGDTMFRHAIIPGFAHALVEIRQDLIATEEGAEAWAARLAPIVDAVNGRTDMHSVQHFGSRTGPL